MKYSPNTLTVRADSLPTGFCPSGIAFRALALIWSIAGLALAPSRASAAFLSGEALDTAADWLALFVLFVVPIGVIVLFWLVHILPEKIAENRHHPQKDAIKTLCLLSLVFGGMLWPIAWLWAYTKPVAYRIAYGTDKHDDYYREMAHNVRTGAVGREAIEHLKGELDDLAAKGVLSAELRSVRDELEAVLAGGGNPSANGGKS